MQDSRKALSRLEQKFKKREFTMIANTIEVLPPNQVRVSTTTTKKRASADADAELDADAEASAPPNKRARKSKSKTKSKQENGGTVVLKNVSVEKLEGSPPLVTLTGRSKHLPVAVPAFELSQIIHFLWDCFKLEIELDLETHSVVILKAELKPTIDAKVIQAAARRFKVTLNPALAALTGKVATRGFSNVVSSMNTPAYITPLYRGEEWRWVMLMYGSRVALLMSNGAAVLLHQKFHGSQFLPPDEEALILALSGPDVLPHVYHNFALEVPTRKALKQLQLKPETLAKIEAVRALKTHVYRHGVLEPFLGPEQELLERMGLIDEDNVLYLHDEADFSAQSFDKLEKRVRHLQESGRILERTFEEKDGATVVYGAHSWPDEELLPLLEGDDKPVELEGLKLPLVTQLPVTQVSTAFSALAARFPEVPPFAVQTELFAWAHPRFNQPNWPAPLKHKQRFDDGSSYTPYFCSSMEDVLKVLGVKNGVLPDFENELVLFDHPDDRESFAMRYPDFVLPGQHFNHFSRKLQDHVSAVTSSTKVCLMTEVFVTQPVGTVFVVARPDVSLAKVSSTLFLVEDHFVFITLEQQ